MMRIPISLITFLAVVTCFDTAAHGQQIEGRFGIMVDAQGVVPVVGLAQRFDPFPTASLGIGRETSPSTYWEVRLQRYDFPRADQLTLAPDTTRSTAIEDSLDVSLEIIGAGLFMHRYFSDEGRLRPFVTIGGGFYHWTDRRGAYEDEHLLLEASKRSQWSGGAHGGVGTEFYVTDRLALQAVVDYTIIFGELWPTLSVGLENVSTFQFASGRIGLRYYF